MLLLPCLQKRRRGNDCTAPALIHERLETRRCYAYTFISMLTVCLLVINRVEARRKQRVETNRHKTLEIMRNEIFAASKLSLDQLVQRASGRPTWSIDTEGEKRGLCPQCNACPGFQCLASLMGNKGAEVLKTHCFHCGCKDSCHEKLRNDASNESTPTST